MPSFGDTALIALIALLLFGPKKLPELARQLGKLMGEFRRASNEFRMQMEDELRISEQTEQKKKIAAMEAAAPVAPAIPQDESIVIDHPHMPATEIATEVTENSIAAPSAEATDAAANAAKPDRHTASIEPDRLTGHPEGPLPIASSGDLDMMPPSTGLPTSRSSHAALSTAFDAIPHTQGPETANQAAPPEEKSREASVHG